MTALSTTCREELAAALNESIDGVQTFAITPPVPPIPGMVIRPDDPYLVIDRVGSRLSYMVALVLTIVTPATDISASVKNAEEMVDLALEHIPTGYSVERISTPTLTDLGAQGSAYTTDVNITAHVTKPREENHG